MELDRILHDDSTLAGRVVAVHAAGVVLEIHDVRAGSHLGGAPAEHESFSGQSRGVARHAQRVAIEIAHVDAPHTAADRPGQEVAARIGRIRVHGRRRFDLEDQIPVHERVRSRAQPDHVDAIGKPCDQGRIHLHSGAVQHADPAVMHPRLEDGPGRVVQGFQPHIPSRRGQGLHAIAALAAGANGRHPQDRDISCHRGIHARHGIGEYSRHAPGEDRGGTHAVAEEQVPWIDVAIDQPQSVQSHGAGQGPVRAAEIGHQVPVEVVEDVVLPGDRVLLAFLVSELPVAFQTESEVVRVAVSHLVVEGVRAATREGHEILDGIEVRIGHPINAREGVQRHGQIPAGRRVQSARVPKPCPLHGQART